jgi:hypothetical protein
MNMLQHAIPHDMRRIKCNAGTTLASLGSGALMLVFLRNLDCPFTRQALADLSSQRAQIEKAGVQIGLVHMASDLDAHEVLAGMGLDDLPRFADPERHLYMAFGLGRCSIHQAFGLPIKLQALALGMELEDVSMMGDPLQMPGVFLVEQGIVVSSYTYRSVSDRPDFRELAYDVLATAV